MHTTKTARLRRALLLSVSCGVAFAAMPAFAQQSPAAEKTDLGASIPEIIVTAQFRSQKLQDTPIAITAIDANLLAARNQTDISQIAAQAPNVQLTQMGGAFGSSMAVYIRGIGQYDFNPAYEPGVGMYVDDVYYASLTGSIMDLLDLERVEVLRGPQGTLTGRNSIGGAIKLFSVKPQPENSGSWEQAVGSRDRFDFRGSGNLVLADSLYARVAAVHKQQDGYVKQVDYGCANPGNSLGLEPTTTASDCVTDKLGSKNYTGVRGSLRYNPNDSLDWVVIGDYTREHQTNSASVLTLDDTSKTDGINFICGRRCTYANFYVPPGGEVTEGYTRPNKTLFTGWGVSNNITYTFSPSVSLQSITAYRKYHQTFGTDDDFTPDPNLAGAGFNDIHFRFFSQELRLSGKVGDLAEWTVGGFYSKQKTQYYTEQDIRYIDHAITGGTGLFNLQFMGNDPVNANSKAAFGTVILHPAEGLTITGGIRYTKEHKDYTFVRKNLEGGELTDIFNVGALDGVKSIYDGDRVDWRLSADYRFSPNIMAYATVSTGFKGGGVVARPFTALQAINGAFNPETLTAYEAGIKTNIGRQLRLNISGFYNDYKNIQLPIADCSVLDEVPVGTDTNVCAAVQNAGDGHMYGAEAELSASPIQGLDIDGSLSWITGAWDRISDVVGGGITIGDPITTPHWRGSFGIQYRADLGTSGSITPRFDMSYVGKQSLGRLNATLPLDYNPSYVLANGRLTWKSEAQDLAISLEVQNMFNKYYLLPLRFTAAYAFAGTGYSTVGRPREWALSVRKTF